MAGLYVNCGAQVQSMTIKTKHNFSDCVLLYNAGNKWYLIFPDDGRAIKCSPKSPKHLENNITAVQKRRPESPGYEYVHTQGSGTRDSLISLCITVIFLRRLFACTCLTASFKHVQQCQQVKKAKKQKCDCTHRAQINPTLDAVRIYLYIFPPSKKSLKDCQELQARCMEYSAVWTFIGGLPCTSKWMAPTPSTSSDKAVCPLLCQPSCQSSLHS